MPTAKKAPSKALSNLIRAQKAMMIQKDTSNLEDFIANNKDKKTGYARLSLFAIEIKYVASYDKRVNPIGKDGSPNNGLGFRVKFILSNGETIGTFSQAAYEFYKVYAVLTGKPTEAEFAHIEFYAEGSTINNLIPGNIMIDVCVVDLDAKKSTYEFVILEDGSDVDGATAYLPSQQGILSLGDGSAIVDTTTGEAVALIE